MTDRAWIKIHSGLTNDPKHEQAMGVRVWLFMWLVDHAVWEDGIVYNYTDAWAGEEMGRSPRTIEKRRQDLQEANYIICHQSFQCQHIRIMRWRNPKLVSPPQINIPGDLPSYAKLRTHPPSTLRTPTLDTDLSQNITDPKVKYLNLFGFTMPFMDEVIIDDLSQDYSGELLVAAVEEIHKRGVSSMKYLAKMVRGGWKPGFVPRKNGKPADAMALRFQAMKMLAGMPYTEEELEETIKALQGAA